MFHATFGQNFNRTLWKRLTIFTWKLETQSPNCIRGIQDKRPTQYKFKRFKIMFL